MDLVDYSRGGVRRDRGRLPRVRRAARPRRRHLHPVSALQGRQRRRAQRARCRGTRARRCWSYLETVEVDRSDLQTRAVPPAGAVGEPARTSTSAASPARSPAASSRRATASRCCRRAARARVDAHRHLRRRPRPRRSPARRSRSRWPTRSTSAAATCSPRPTRRRTSPTSSRRRIVWMARRAAAARPPLPAEDRHAARSPRTVAPLKYKVNVNTLEHARGQAARAERDRRRATSSSTAPIAFDPYAENRDTGGFILIDRLTNAHGRRRACSTSRCAARTTSTGRRSTSTRRRARGAKGQQPCVVWFTGLSGAGKSTIANLVEKRAARARPPHLPARRRQRAPRPEQGPRLHRRRPRREHPPRRRGGAS